MDSKRALASLGAALALLACDDKEDSAPLQPSVEASYQELAGAFTTCDQTLQECGAESEGDWTALGECGLAYRDCRDKAGVQALKTMAVAIRACAEEAHECKQNAEGYAETASCRRQLWSCLGDQSPGSTDDASAGESDDDGGTAEHGHDHSVVRDCIEKLKASVEAAEDAHICARNIRMCIADAVPRSDHRPSEASRAAAPSSAAAKRSTAARECVGEFRGCLREHGPRECVEALRRCTHPSAPVQR